MDDQGFANQMAADHQSAASSAATGSRRSFKTKNKLSNYRQSRTSQSPSPESGCSSLSPRMLQYNLNLNSAAAAGGNLVMRTVHSPPPQKDNVEDDIATIVNHGLRSKYASNQSVDQMPDMSESFYRKQQLATREIE